MVRSALAVFIVLALAMLSAGYTQEGVFIAELSYHTRGTGPAPNFSPKGTQVPLTDLAASHSLPAGAARPARSGILKLGPGKSSWMPILAAADASHPTDLCLIYLDRNRNGNFSDDGPALTAKVSRNEKTGAWWSNFPTAEISVPYATGAKSAEPYMINIWIVREADEAPSVLRYSVSSWRSGTVRVNGVDALVAAMDSNNDAVFDKEDWWSVLSAGEPDAAKRVLSIDEARQADRFMFVKSGDKEMVLEFRAITPDGRRLTFAVVDRPVTKAEDRAPDDGLAAERSRPRTPNPFVWAHGSFEVALRDAKTSGKRVVLDFETSWCGPCKQMDQWIWSDAEVATLLQAGFIGVKLDGDVERALVKRFAVTGYPTVVIVDAEGKEAKRFVGYQSSKEVLQFLR